VNDLLGSRFRAGNDEYVLAENKTSVKPGEPSYDLVKTAHFQRTLVGKIVFVLGIPFCIAGAVGLMVAEVGQIVFEESGDIFGPVLKRAWLEGGHSLKIHGAVYARPERIVTS